MKELSLHILDIAQNSIRAKASQINIYIIESIKNDIFKIIIEDDGEGMSKETISKVTDPFFTSRTTRKVGLGLSLLKQNAEKCEGNFNFFSEVGLGTKLIASFKYSHWDRPELGDISGVIVILATSNPNINFVYQHITDKGTYIFDTNKIKQTLGEIPINDIHLHYYLKEMIFENLSEIRMD